MTKKVARGGARREPPCAGDGARGDAMRVAAGKNRPIQVARCGQRKLFDAARKALFLEWLAATCNVCLSAEQAGVAYQTPFKHRRTDPAFEAAWDEAIADAYPRIEARLLQEAHQPPVEVSEAVAAAAEETFDPQLALILLREHARRLPGSPDKRKHQRYGHRVASNAEVLAALEKRLAGFALRQGQGSKKKH